MAYSSSYTKKVLKGTYEPSLPKKKKKKQEETKEKRTWFNTSAFDDGYQFGDITKTGLSTISDVGENVSAGIIGIGEKTVDAGAYAVGKVGSLFGNDEIEDKMSAFIQKDLVDEEKIAKKFNFANTLLAGGLNKLVNDGSTENSLLGEKSDSLVQSAGQLLGTAGLQMVGVPWYLTSGVTSFGGETENALKSGATYNEAGFSGLVTAGAEILTEKISGGISFGGKTLDAGVKNKISEAITSKTLSNLTKFGIDVVGEGGEEVLSEVLSNVGKKLSYEDEKTWGEILASEEALDSYLESFIGGMVLGGGANVGKVTTSIKQGRDYDTGLTPQEELIVGVETNNRIESVEAEGNKLTAKQKEQIREQVKSEVLNNQRQQTITEDIAPVQEQQVNTIDNVQDIDSQIATLEEQLMATENEAEYQRLSEQIKALEEQANQLEQQDIAPVQAQVNEQVQNEDIAPFKMASVEETRQPTTQEVNSNLPVEVESNTQEVEESPVIEEKSPDKTGNVETDIKQKQLDIILKENPMTDDYHTGIRTKEDIKTFDEVINDDESFVWGDFSQEDAKKALEKGEVTVYSSYPIEQGVFVSTSKNQAQDYAGNGKVYSKVVPLNEVAWINGDEGQYAKVEESSSRSQESDTKPETKRTTPTQEELDNLEYTRKNKSGSEYASEYYDLQKKYGTGLFKGLNNYKSTGQALEEIAPVKQELEDLTSDLKETIKDTKKEIKTLKKELNEAKSTISELVEESKALTEVDLPYFENLSKEAVEQDIAPTRNNLTMEESQELDALEDSPFGLTLEEEARLKELSDTENNSFNMQDTISMDKKSLKALSKNIKTILGLNKAQTTELENAIQEYMTQETATKEDLHRIIDSKFGKQSVETKLDEVVDIQRVIRQTKIKPTDDLRQMTDYFQMKQKNFGKVSMSNSGMSVDKAYQELSGMYPEFFPDNITNSADQFERIIQVANMDKVISENIILPEEKIQDVTDFVYESVQDYKYSEYVKMAEQEYQQGLNLDIAPYEPTIEETTEIAPTLKVSPEMEQKAIKPKTSDEINYDAFKEMFEKETQKNRNELGYTPKDPTKESSYLEDSSPMKEISKLKQAKLTFQNLFTNSRAVYDEIAKETGNNEIKYKADRLNTIYGETADITTAQLDNSLNPVGKSINAIFENAENQGLAEAGQDYLYHLSNINRHKRGKGSAKFTAKDSQRFVNEFSMAYPELATQLRADNQTWNKNRRNNLIDAGIISEETSTLFEELDIDYVPFFVDMEYTPTYNTVGEIKTKQAVKRAIGGSKEVLPIKEAMIKQLTSDKVAIAQNDLYKEIIRSYGTLAPMGADVRLRVTDFSDSLYADTNGDKYLTAYIDGERKSIKISDYMYDNIKQVETIEQTIRNVEDQLSVVFKPLQAFSSFVRNIHTNWSPTFVITNPLKDIQDAPFNSKDAAKFIKNYPSSWTDVNYAKNVNEYAKQFKKLTGQDIRTITDSSNLSGEAKSLYNKYENGSLWNKFVAGYGSVKLYGDTYSNMDKTIAKETQTKGKNKLSKVAEKVSDANEFMELATRYAEFKTSIENGASITEAFYNAKDITTNFGRGGVITKALNRNGATFLNASIQGFSKFYRNFSGENGTRGRVGSIAKAITLGVLPAILNHLFFDDDEEYEALPDYIKDNYYLIKTGDGEFIRIPKGRALSVFGSAGRRTLELADGEEDAFEGYLKNAMSQSGPNNFLESNAFAPFIQAKNNETWYGGDLVPTRLQDKPVEEQYDASTDEFSKWLGQMIGVSPYKINYVVDQYTGGIGDIFLPMITEEANNDGSLLAPIKDKFTANSTMDNKYAGEFYDTKDELEITANGEKATEEDQLKSQYMSAVSWEMSELYKEKREIQSDSSLSKEEKYERVKSVQDQINDIAKNALETYEYGTYTENYASIGDYQFYKYVNDEGEETWKQVNEEEAEDLANLGMTDNEYNEYFGMKKSFSELNNRYYEVKDELIETYGEDSDEYSDALSDLYLEKKNMIIDEIMNSNLTSEEKAYLYNKNYNSKSVDVITTAGIDIDYLLDYEKNDFEADYNYKGKAISGSRKNKVINYVNDYDLSIAEKAILIKSRNSFKFNDYNYEIVNYVDGLDIEYEEKVKLLKTLDMEVKEDGTITWK